MSWFVATLPLGRSADSSERLSTAKAQSFEGEDELSVRVERDIRGDVALALAKVHSRAGRRASTGSFRARWGTPRFTCAGVAGESELKARSLVVPVVANTVAVGGLKTRRSAQGSRAAD